MQVWCDLKSVFFVLFESNRCWVLFFCFVSNMLVNKKLLHARYILHLCGFRLYIIFVLRSKNNNHKVVGKVKIGASYELVIVGWKLFLVSTTIFRGKQRWVNSLWIKVLIFPLHNKLVKLVLVETTIHLNHSEIDFQLCVEFRKDHKIQWTFRIHKLRVNRWFSMINILTNCKIWNSS